MPFQDGTRGADVSSSPPPEAWEAWRSAGRQITGVEGQLIQMLAGERDQFLRARIVVGLGQVGGAASVEPLTRTLESDVPFIQTEAARALGALGQPPAIEPLCEALDSSDPSVRASACTALARFASPRSAECLRKALGDPDPFVRSAASAALGAGG